MKRFFYFSWIVVFYSCQGKNNAEGFTIEGKISHASDQTIYLEENSYEAKTPVIVDSATVKNSSFTLQASPKGESLFSLRAGPATYPFALLINDNRKITIEADLSKEDPYLVQGSPASNELLSFRRKMKEEGMKMENAVNQYEHFSQPHISDSISADQKDILKKNSITQYQAAADEMKNFTVDLISKTNSAVVSLYVFGDLQRLFDQFGVKAFSRSESSTLVDKMTNKFPDHPAVLNLRKNTASSKATDFKLPDTSGRLLPLSSLLGKYVLVDFWASWCKPCREENPNVVAAFRKYHQKNFTILGVSLDQNKEQWLQAIRNDSLSWNHVSDLKYWDNEAAALYNVHSIPYNFLVDPGGNIVAENIRGADLFSTLEKFLK